MSNINIQKKNIPAKKNSGYLKIKTYKFLNSMKKTLCKDNIKFFVKQILPYYHSKCWQSKYT